MAASIPQASHRAASAVDQANATATSPANLRALDAPRGAARHRRILERALAWMVRVRPVRRADLHRAWAGDGRRPAKRFCRRFSDRHAVMP
ncbi:hypothetical protein [Methylobacterium sp. J-070]|uniref:hypothetical protein n=1 Tax=Methylobacterium sp. J-070 TaxID=2836650 RepID=UPI001FBB75EE|nr:hypothetical protein [Methylobacterium sp. J-070]MCJ2050446.1 hypothetical protein [Methylobacterium sp. J-070]